MTKLNALLTAADKSNVPDLARALHEGGFTIVSFGGTAQLITDETDIPVVSSEDFLGDKAPSGLETLPERPRREIIAAYLGQSLSLKADRLVDMGWPVLDFAYVNLTPSDSVKSDEHDYNWMKLDKGGDFMIRSAIEGRRPVLVRSTQIPHYIKALEEDGTSPMLNPDYLAHMALTHLVTLDNRSASTQSFLVERDHFPQFKIFDEQRQSSA